MKKLLLIYFVVFYSLSCFAQYFQAGDVHLGFKISRQRTLQILVNQLDFYELQKRPMLVGEYHISENVSLYAQYDIKPKSAFANDVEKTIINTTFNGWSVGGRWFSPGLFHGHLYLYGDLGYGQFDVLKTKVDAIDNFELEKTNDNLRFSGLAGGFTIKPSRRWSIDVNLFRIGALEKTFIANPNSEMPTRIHSSRLLVGTPFFSSDYETVSFRINFIFSTQKHTIDE
jgi:hypothetical protein